MASTIWTLLLKVSRYFIYSQVNERYSKVRWSRRLQETCSPLKTSQSNDFFTLSAYSALFVDRTTRQCRDMGGFV